MISIPDQELLSLWEVAQAAHPVARPAVLLRAAGEHPEPERLPIGDRDRRLLALRERWFGRSFECVDECPQCRTAIELTFETPPPAAAETAPRTIRLPDTNDLLAAAACGTAEESRALLAARCSGETQLDEAAIRAVAEELERADPEGALVAPLTCPACGTQWEALLDPGLHLWHDLQGAVSRLFREVDALAAAYGWSEADVLTLSAARRAVYLRMVTA